MSITRTVGRALTGRQALTATAVVALLFAALGFHFAQWAEVPAALRFVTGLVTLGVAPGLLLCGPFFSARGPRGSADFAIAVITCSLACTLAFNGALFLLEWSLRDLAYSYVLLQLAGYAAWSLWWFTRAARPVAANSSPVTRGQALGWAGAAAVLYVIYTAGSPIANPEEMVVLRKLVENPTIRYDNLSYRAGDANPSVFVPFQILVGGTAVIARIDAAQVHTMFRVVTTGLSMYIIGALAFVISGRREVAGLAGMSMLAIAVLDPDTVAYGAGSIAVFPTAESFAAGALLPLLLLLFWSGLREPGPQLGRWVLLGCVAVVITTTEARETLLALGTIAAVLALLLAHWRDNRQPVLRIAAVLALAGLVLILYRQFNITWSPGLDARAASAASWDVLRRMVVDQSPLNLLTAAGLSSAEELVRGPTLDHLGNSFDRSMFVDSWRYAFVGRLYLPIVLLILPLFALTAKSVSELSMAVVLTVLGLVTSSGLLNLLISAFVGHPGVIVLNSVITLFSMMVLWFAAWNLSVALTRRAAATTVRLRLSGPTDDQPDWLIAVDTRYVTFAIAVILVCLLCWMAEQLIDLRGHATVSVDRFALLWLLLSAAAVVYRVRRNNLPLFCPGVRTHRTAFFFAAFLVWLPLMPAVLRNVTGPRIADAADHAFSGVSAPRDGAPLEADRRRGDSQAYPLPVIEFLRQQVPPNETVLASDALALLGRVAHFTPVVSSKREVSPSFHLNHGYLRDYSRTGTYYALAPFVQSDDSIERFGRMLAEYQVDLVLVDPDEHEHFQQARARSSALRQTMEPVFENGGYAIYAVRDSRQPGAAP